MAGTAIQTFGKYQILERIATGGMAEIYKARLEGIGGFQRTFAIKRILPNLSQNAEYIAMLVDEAKVAGLLSHANIVQILDLGQVDGIWYIAMEYVHGRDLGGVLRRADKKGLRLPVPHAVFITIELLKGLEYAHQRQVMRGGRPVALNIIHRDISPPNVLLSYQGEVKLTDFGIARANLRAMETVSGLVKGRFDYMSPEQAAGAKDLDQRSDLFSVGVVLYEMLTGHHPFRADNEIQTVERVRTGKYVPVSQRNPEVPFTLETIVDRALRVGRDERYPSATAFKEALDKFFHDAGFIFTHATLAAYVKGLFPESANRGSVQPPPPRHVRPGAGVDAATEVDDLDLQPDDPTGNLDRRALARDAQRTPPAFGMRSSDLEPTAVHTSPIYGTDFADESDEQETLIRKAPSGWEDPSSTDVNAPGNLAEALQGSHQGETLIRQSPLLEPDEDDEDDLLDESSGRMSLTSSGRTSSGRRGTTSSGRRRSGPSIGWLGWVLSALSLLLGLMAGVSAAIVLGWLAGFRAVGASQNEPAVRLVAPAGTQFRVDGDAVGSEVTVSPGVQHQVEIGLRDHEPWTETLVLQPGEERIYVITPVEPQPRTRDR